MNQKIRGVSGTNIFGARTPQSEDELISILEFFSDEPLISRVTWINCSSSSQISSSTEEHLFSSDVLRSISGTLSRPLELKHHRVSIPDEGAPSDSFYSTILPHLQGIANQNEAAWVFSSRKGAEKATTGMVIATLFLLAERKRLKLDPLPGLSAQDAPESHESSKFRPRVLARLMKGDLFSSPQDRISEVDIAIHACGKVFNFANELSKTHYRLLSRVPSPPSSVHPSDSGVSIDEISDEFGTIVRSRSNSPVLRTSASPSPTFLPRHSPVLRPATPPPIPSLEATPPPSALLLAPHASSRCRSRSRSPPPLKPHFSDHFDDADRADPENEIWFRRGHNLLEKYLSFILFNAYLHESLIQEETLSATMSHAPTSGTLEHHHYHRHHHHHHHLPRLAISEWMKQRPAVFRIMRDLNLYKQLFNGISETEVLKDKVLKYDHFFGISKLPELYPNAVNFRKVDGLPIYGVGQCCVDAFAPVLEHVAKDGYSRVIWVNLRQEPVCFVYGRPYAPRESTKINENVEYPGIDGDEIQVLEERMRDEIIEIIETSGEFKFWKQVEHGNNVTDATRQEFDSDKDAIILSEIYEELRNCGKNVSYKRIPITDETAPEEKDFVQLVDVLRGHTTDTAYIYNCQMGRGRTTTGMVTCVMMLRMMAAAAGEDVPTKEPEIKGPEFRSVLELFRILPEARESKREVDIAIDMADAMQNLREAIRECRTQSKTEKTQERRDFYLRRTLKYVERYVFLIIFHVYLRDQFDKPQHNAEPFTMWMSKRPMLYELLDHLDPTDESELPISEEPVHKLTLWQSVKKSLRARIRSLTPPPMRPPTVIIS